MEITRFAETVWNGDLLSGNGTINYVSSGSISRLPGHLGIAHRGAQRADCRPRSSSPRRTPPASRCRSPRSSRRTRRPRRSSTSRRSITFAKGDAGWKIAKSDLTVRGVVPGIDAAGSRSSRTWPRTGARFPRRSRATSSCPWTPRSSSRPPPEAGLRPCSRPGIHLRLGFGAGTHGSVVKPGFRNAISHGGAAISFTGEGANRVRGSGADPGLPDREDPARVLDGELVDLGGGDATLAQARQERGLAGRCTRSPRSAAAGCCRTRPG